jgi:hypothetical protein
MSSSGEASPSQRWFRGHGCRELHRAIFESEAPEQIIRQLPAQSLFMVVRHLGLSGAADIISLASIEQCRLLSDFDLWNRDTINEDHVWEWLAITDETDSLDLLQKIVKCVDLKVLSVVISRYTDVRIFSEPTDLPPGPGFHTPDKGYTWVGITVQDADRHFLLARLLALIFETSAELYYQLLSIPSVATVSMLEEESFVERSKRLAAEGIPEPEAAAMVHQPYPLATALQESKSSEEQRLVVEDIRAVEPLLYESRASRFVAELLRDVSDHEAFEMEFTYIMNAAIVRFSVDFCEQDRVMALADKVKGAINLGLEKLVQERGSSPKELYNSLGLGKLYRLGFTELMALRSEARKISVESMQLLQDDPVVFSCVACVREAFPEMPLFLRDDGSVDEGMGTGDPAKPLAGHRPIDTLRAVASLRDVLTRAARREQA